MKNESKTWNPVEVFLFRLAFIFFVALTIPYDHNLFAALWHTGFGFEDIFQLATYRTNFVAESLYVGNHLEGYYNWLIAFIIALVGTFVWGGLSRNKKVEDYDQLYYWLRVLLRYRLAIAVIATGIVKFFPIQLPKPTLSDYNTEYGDFLLWKIYYLSTSITKAGYVSSLGLLEVVGGLLLLFRRTAPVGAGLLIALLSNIVISNYVYEIGEQVYSSFLILLAIVIFAYDFPRFFNLLFREVKSFPDTLVPLYNGFIARYKPVLKAIFVLFFVFFGVSAYSSWKRTNYPYPNTSGIAHVRGLYNVKDFVINGDTIPYSLVDSLRWQNVVFESWNTLSIRSNESIAIDRTKPRIVWQADVDRNFEQTGSGGRHFYRYDYAQTQDSLYRIRLVNKTDTLDSYDLLARFTGKDDILLRGKRSTGDTLSIRLERLPKEYLLDKGRRKPIKIY